MWIYKGKEVKKAPEGYIGFVYIITLLIDTAEYKKGTIYVGKKIFSYTKKTKLSKKARKNTRKRVKIESVDSQWLNYFGSNLELKALVKELGSDNFKREILHFCVKKAEMSYLELKEQVLRDIFYKPSFNKWIYCKIYKSSL